jgi:hypothetical protein
MAVRMTAAPTVRIALSLAAVLAAAWPAALPARNLLIFVADGLRADSVNRVDAPTLSALAARGVRFVDSHAVFPTFTTPNAASIATGRYPGDTGDFSNSLYVGYRLFNAGNFGQRPANDTPFLESDLNLGDLDDHYRGNFLGVPSLLAIAREAGMGTAAIGKLGPVAIQDVSQLDPLQLTPQGAGFAVPQTDFIDDATGSASGIPLAPDLAAALAAAQLPLATPTRVQPAGNARLHGTVNANWGQQVYFVEAATRAVLPLLIRQGHPFVLLYWSRDPDGTQHNEGDSLNRLVPGINGRTSHEAVRNADEDLRQLLDALDADPRLAANTDVFVTSDHGFATISKQPIDAAGTATRSAAAQARYADVPQGFLPPGFLALDLAAALDEPLYDPDDAVKDAHGNPVWRRVREGHHPRSGNGIIGGSGAALERTDADVLVTANGGSDLIYLPRPDAALARHVVQILSGLDYVGALFTADALGPMPGALPFRSIGLSGHAQLPDPSIVADRPARCAAEWGANLRHAAAAGPGQSRQLRPRQYLQFHGRRGSGFPCALSRPAAGGQCGHRSHAAVRAGAALAGGGRSGRPGAARIAQRSPCGSHAAAGRRALHRHVRSRRGRTAYAPLLSARRG